MKAVKNSRKIERQNDRNTERQKYRTTEQQNNCQTVWETERQKEITKKEKDVFEWKTDDSWMVMGVVSDRKS